MKPQGLNKKERGGTMKKIVGFVLTIVLLLSVSLVAVYAQRPGPEELPRQQRPVSDPTIVFGSSGGGTYTFDILWSRPPESTVNAPHNLLQSELVAARTDAGIPVWTLFPVRYLLEFRNATYSQGFNSNQNLPSFYVETTDQARRPQVWDRRESTGSRTYTMLHSSLYEIGIVPIKMHPTVTINTETTPPTRSQVFGMPALIDTSPGGPPRRNLIFMTDIQVRAEGRGNTITVEWHEPTWGGTTVFPYWEISYARYAGDNMVAGANSRVVTVGDGAGQVQRLADGRLSYTFTDPAIRPIGFYRVAVEPMLGPNQANPAHRVRTRPGQVTPGSPPPPAYREITILGNLFNIAFSPTTITEYSYVVMMIPELFIDVIGADFIHLWWSHLGALATPDPGGDAPTLSHVVIEEWHPDATNTDDLSNRIGEIVTIGAEGFLTGVNYFPLGPGIPRVRRGFVLALHMLPQPGGPVLRTNIVIYDPLEVDFSPYRPEIVRLEPVQESGVNRLSLEILGFARHPVVPEEEDLVTDEFGGRLVDTALRYEIFISDSFEDLMRLTTPLMIRTPDQMEAGRRLNIVEPQPAEPTFDPTWALFNHDYIRYFQTITETGVVNMPIVDNRMYFVRIRAVRVPGEQTSSWAYGQVFVPPDGGIVVTPEMINSPPVEIVEEDVEPEMLPIRWPLIYLEVERPTLTPHPPHPDDPITGRNNWYAVIGVDRRGHAPFNHRVIYGRSVDHIENVVVDNIGSDGNVRHTVLNDLLPPNIWARMMGHGTPPLNLNSPEAVGTFLNNEVRARVQNYVSGLGGNIGNPNLRIQNMVDRGFEIHVVPYDVMMDFADDEDDCPFEEYLAFINSPTSTATWQSITDSMEVTNNVARFDVTSFHSPNVGTLRPNTSYVIFIRSYQEFPNGERRVSFYPAYVIGTTPPDIEEQIPTPTTPILFPVPEFTTRRNIGVRWRVQDSMIYEIRWSEFMRDYTDGGTLITWEEIQEAFDDEDNPSGIRLVNGVPYYFLRIDYLFPYTLHHVWARAIGVDSSGTIQGDSSQWSNPVDIRTLDIEPPAPPRNLNRANFGLVDFYNRMNETTYDNREPNSLMISFMRIFADLHLETERDDDATITGGEARVLELPTDSHNAIYLLRFEELIGNRTYYVRGRTILTVERDGDTGIRETYSYEIQVADNPDFLDAITIITPPAPDIPPNTNMARRAYSIWVGVELETGQDDEFDGAHRPGQYPLPERDYEITYDPITQTLSWRFRTNQRGADGLLDQNVDQRFISRLINQRVFTFTADLNEFGNQPITNRTVIVPLSIIRAFESQGITFEILAGDHSVRIPPGALDTSEVRALNMGVGTYVHIGLNSVQGTLPALATNTSYATVPQALNIRIVADNGRQINLNTFSRPIEVRLPMDNHIAPYGVNTGLFISGSGIHGWEEIGGTVNPATNTISGGLNRPATVAGITRVTPPTSESGGAQNHPSFGAMQRVTSRMTFTDMIEFDPAEIVSANAFNNVMAAMLHNRNTVTMGANLPASESRAMENARFLAPQNQSLTREQAMDIMIRFYELRTQQVLQPMTTPEMVPGMMNVSDQFLPNMLKAADLGFISGPVFPQGELTMGELMTMLDIVIQDVGR